MKLLSANSFTLKESKIWERVKLLSAKAFNLEKSRFFICHKEFTLSLLLTKQEAFVDSINQEQTAQNMQSDL